MIWLRLIGGVFARIWQPVMGLLTGWLVRGQRERVKDLEAEIETRERMDEAEHFDHDSAGDADEWLRQRAHKRSLQRDD